MGVLPGLAFSLVAAVSVAAQTSASFVWQPNTEGDLAGYRFYQEHGQPVQRTVTKLGLVGRHTVSNLVLGRTYRFYVTAINQSGLESAPSQAVTLTADTGTETSTAEPLPQELAAIVIDNSDTAAVTRTGEWVGSTSNGPYWGANYLHDRSSGKGSKSVVYNATLPYSGTYEVALYYSVGSTRSTFVPVDITHAGGTTRVRVNQRLNGSQWYPLGTFAFDSSRPARVRIGNEGTSGHVIADGVRLRPVSVSISKTATTPIADVSLSPGDLITTFPSLQFSRISQLDHALQLTWPTASGSAYELEQTDDLNNAWTVVANLIGSGETATVIVEDLDNNPRFWRVKCHPTATPESPGSVASASQQSPAPAN